MPFLRTKINTDLGLNTFLTRFLFVDSQVELMCVKAIQFGILQLHWHIKYRRSPRRLTLQLLSNKNPAYIFISSTFYSGMMPSSTSQKSERWRQLPGTWAHSLQRLSGETLGSPGLGGGSCFGDEVLAGSGADKGLRLVGAELRSWDGGLSGDPGWGSRNLFLVPLSKHPFSFWALVSSSVKWGWTWISDFWPFYMAALRRVNSVHIQVLAGKAA